MPPKASNKKKGPSQDDESEIIFSYLRRQNRPYSAADIYNNLKLEIGKGNVQKILTTLLDEAKIAGKQYGKQMVYVCRQDEFETPSAEELEAMDSTIEQIKNEITVLTENNHALGAELSKLNNSMTDAELESRLAELADENSKSAERLEKLKAGQQLVTDEERRKIDQDYDTYRKHWQVRKRMFKEAWAMVTENLPDKPAELMERLGVETDEMHNMDFSRDWMVQLA
ncbi:hypothetical protein SeMB42_g05131 [Synchytrium endobioticum]|uniref:Homologous-pairing protein 2 homolog n=1 Tax=Synchytrium endobioticum TaxID=286115 RepID=A0A507CTD1_9FUNG|nr:hypothetical protein SeMB42_g05131 [Synchytrium endobioticum]